MNKPISIQRPHRLLEGFETMALIQAILAFYSDSGDGLHRAESRSGKGKVPMSRNKKVSAG